MTDDLKHCPDCFVVPGERHSQDCDIARCSECGDQFGDECKDGQPTVWTGEWPGKAECREFGFWTQPDSPWGVMEDLNTLYTHPDVQWDRSLERFVMK